MKKKKVLIVDDELLVRKLIRITLESHGFEVMEVENGLDAIRKVEVDKPGLILLDLMMPKMDGYETCQVLKANPETAQIPIIMLTARGEPSAREMSGKIGVSDFLTKPFSPKAMAERVREVFNRSDATG